MIVEYKNRKLQKSLQNYEEARKRYGSEMAKLIILRIEQLIAAQNLSDVSKIPAARLHPLKGDRKGLWALDLKHPFRLIIRAVPEGNCSIADLESIKIIRVEEVTNYHDR